MKFFTSLLFTGLLAFSCQASSFFSNPLKLAASRPVAPVNNTPVADVLNYVLDQSSGSSATDASPNNNTGALLGGENWVSGGPGSRGHSYNFNGGQTITPAANTGMNFAYNSHFSAAFWINFNTIPTTSSGKAILSSLDPGLGLYRGWEISCGDLANGKIVFYLISIYGVAAIAESFNYTFTTGAWHFVCLTYDGSGNASGAKLYVDGSLQSNDTPVSQDTLGTATTTNAKITYVGSRTDVTYALDAKVSSVKVFSTTLSAGDVTTLNALGQ